MCDIEFFWAGELGALFGCSRSSVGHRLREAIGRRLSGGAAEEISGERGVTGAYGGFHRCWRGSCSPSAIRGNQHRAGTAKGDEYFCDALLDDVPGRPNNPRVLAACGLVFQFAAVGSGELAEL